MKNLMEWKERGYVNAPSITVFFGDDYPEKEIVIRYLTECGIVRYASTGEGVDVLTGAVISKTYVGLDDGEYMWMNTLPYYIRKYNLRLPKEFEQKALCTIGGKRRLTSKRGNPSEN
ncbi:MAG: hypothetical protein IJ794_10160 [Lachnospiraceae bacterium]|nr:hypothetical protein [Lachnospiraceae bacterium]